MYQATTFNMDLDDSMNTMDFDPTGTVDYVIKVNFISCHRDIPITIFSQSCSYELTFGLV